MAYNRENGAIIPQAKPPSSVFPSVMRQAHQCFECGEVFWNKYEMKDHIYLRHDTKIECFSCGKSFATLYDYVEHTTRHQNDRNYVSIKKKIKLIDY